MTNVFQIRVSMMGRVWMLRMATPVSASQDTLDQAVLMVCRILSYGSMLGNINATHLVDCCTCKF